MSISYQIENQEKYLKVLTSGKDDSLEEVIAYAMEVVNAAIQFNCRKILCDERELEYSISVIDTYQLAEIASQYAFTLTKIAIVCDTKFLESGKFYETVASNRGLCVRVTSNYEDAIEWLG